MTYTFQRPGGDHAKVTAPLDEYSRRSAPSRSTPALAAVSAIHTYVSGTPLVVNCNQNFFGAGANARCSCGRRGPFRKTLR
jgi:hypothetical protein